MHLQDANIPMWVIKAKGQTYYVNHVDMDSGIGFQQKKHQIIHQQRFIKI
jgi:hypothetical protein